MKSLKSKNNSDFYKLFKPQLTPKKNVRAWCIWWFILWVEYQRIP